MGNNGSRSFSKAQRKRIAERDGWICQLCLLPIPKDTVETGWEGYDPLYPSLDHIITYSQFSQSGNDADINLQLAHLQCNVWRNNRTTWRPNPEQLHQIFTLVQPRLSPYGVSLKDIKDI